MKIVDKETALRLKSLGYDGEAAYWYNESCTGLMNLCMSGSFASPYWEQVCDWLREKHGIFVWVSPRKNFGVEPVEYEGSVVLKKDISVYCTKVTLNTKGATYDITLEGTIKQALDLIEKKK